MPCQINNSSNVDLSSIEPHVQGMYDFFDQKLGFQKPPTMHFDSDPSNQANVLGKTAYYDPSSLEIHVFTDGRHPKDMLRSIAHELIHHQQNLEGRLNVGGYMGEGYYLENEEMRKLEHEAMLEGNANMREWEDTVKKENKQMSLKEWKNNELNKLMLEKFGLLKESVNEEVVEEIAEATECPKCGAEECKCDAMNEEVVEEEKIEEITGRGPENETYYDPEAAADRYRSDDDPRGRKQDGPSPTKANTGKNSPSGKRFAQAAGVKSTMGRFPNLQEALKRFAKAKSIKIKK